MIKQYLNKLIIVVKSLFMGVIPCSFFSIRNFLNSLNFLTLNFKRKSIRYSLLSIIFLFSLMPNKTFSQCKQAPSIGGPAAVVVGSTIALTITGPSGGDLVSSSPGTAAGYRVHKFTTVGSTSFITPVGFIPSNFEYLVVGGGGGGGANGGGGGGAGAYTTNTNYLIAANTTYPVTVGDGGLVGTNSGGAGVFVGGSSVFGTGTVITSTGGGGGASRDAGGNALSGGSGGGGGGASTAALSTGVAAGGSGTSKSAGGNGNWFIATVGDKGCYSAGGGGGGAGAVGGNGGFVANTSATGGNGGAGISSSISGTATFYAGGGGGGITCYPPAAGKTANNGSGGSAVGGAGGPSGGVGTANTGSGGGGGSAGGAGGTGIVIVRYADVTAGTWSSSAPAVATVNASTGVVTGVAYGTTTISYIYGGAGFPCTASPAQTKVITVTAPLTITAYNIPKCQGSTYTFAGTEFATSGLKNTDAVTSATFACAGAAAGAGAGASTITPSAAVGSGLSNYTITYATGTMTVYTLPAPDAITGTTSINCAATSVLTTAGLPTGGTITSSGGYRIHKFTTDGQSFTTLGFNPGTVEVLIVAGGGGGGGFGGGGGAGGVIYTTSSVAASTGYAVTVGSGGNGGAYNSTNGNDGQASVFNGITAAGGGGGGTRICGSPCYGQAGDNGGSGGGGSPADGTTLGIGGTASPAGQGNDGGTESSFGWGGSGGGGAGAVGVAGSGNTAGAGGNGKAFSISGASVTYGGGGGGCVYNAGSGLSAAAGGSGGGGAGGTNTTGVAGTANTGGGGGGGDAGYSGGAGGLGIVIIRYPDPTGGTWSSNNGQVTVGTTTVTATSSATTITGVSAGSSATISYSYPGASGCTSTAVTAPITVGACSAIALASNTISAACKVPSTLKVPIQSFSGAITVGNGNLTNVQFTTTGSYAQADIVKYQLWYSASNTFPGTATQVGADLLTAGGGAGTRSFAAFTTPTLTSGTTYYFWITVDVVASPTSGNTITCNAITAGDLTYAGTQSGGPTTAGGTQTLQAAPAAPTSMKSY